MGILSSKTIWLFKIKKSPLQRLYNIKIIYYYILKTTKQGIRDVFNLEYHKSLYLSRGEIFD